MFANNRYFLKILLEVVKYSAFDHFIEWSILRGSWSGTWNGTWVSRHMPTSSETAARSKIRCRCETEAGAEMQAEA